MTPSKSLLTATCLRGLTIGLPLIVVSPSPAPASGPASTPDALIGFASAARRVQVAALIRGRIAQLPFDDGDSAPAEAPILKLDDRVQRLRYEAARAEAESKLEIDLASVKLTAATAEQARIESLAKDNRASAKELDDARAYAAAARIELQQAEFEQLQQERDAALQAQLLEQHVIAAPFAGYISQRLKQPGDVVDELEPVLVLSQIDPLEVVIECPVRYAGAFKVGAEIPVTPAEGNAAPRMGRVSLVNEVANAASQTFRLKLVVPNADRGWMAGVKVSVPPPAPLPPANSMRPASPHPATDSIAHATRP